MTTLRLNSEYLRKETCYSL